MMKKYKVITERKEDALLLRALRDIAAHDTQITVESTGGWSVADSYARSVLVMNEADVALVVDADSTDPSVVEDRIRFLHHSLSSIPSHKKFHITVIEPDIVSLLFQDRFLLEELIVAPFRKQIWSKPDTMQGKS